MRGSFRIEQDDLGLDAEVPAGMRARSEQVVEGLDAVAGDGDLVFDVIFTQRTKRQLFVIGTIFDEQDGPLAAHRERLPNALRDADSWATVRRRPPTPELDMLSRL